MSKRKKADVIELVAHPRMSNEQALAYAARLDWESVMILGYSKANPEFITFTGAMTREEALWLVEHAKLHVLNRLDG